MYTYVKQRTYPEAITVHKTSPHSEQIARFASLRMYTYVMMTSAFVLPRFVFEVLEFHGYIHRYTPF